LKPSEIPIYQVDKLTTVINLKALGLTIPSHCSPAPTSWSN